MAKSSGEQVAPLLPESSQSRPPPETCYGYPVDLSPAYYLVPLHSRLHPSRGCGCRFSSSVATTAAFLVVLSAAVFIFWPSDPTIEVVRVNLDRIRVVTDPTASLDISMGLLVRVRNPDFFSLDYDSVNVLIKYRGKDLGSVSSDGGRVRARRVSFVEAELHLDGVSVVEEVFYLIRDLAKGSIPLDTHTEVDGKLRLLFVDVPIQGKIACAMRINPENQTIMHQDCYPE